MGQVTVIVNSRTYRLMCGPGEEQRLTDLAEHVRQRIDDLSYEFGNAGDERLLLMTTLMITDELWDTKARLAQLEARLIEAGLPEDTVEIGATEPLPNEGKETAGVSADAVQMVPASSEPPATSESAATSPPAPIADPFVQEPSLKRALRRPQQRAAKASLEDRLLEAREPLSTGPRKTGTE